MNAFAHVYRATILLNLATIGTISLLVLRASAVIHFDAPQHVVTSGYEEESLFAVWKYIQGLPLYQSPHEIPFSATYFNWLFYCVYGSFTSIILWLLNLDASWIPTIGRCFSLCVIGLGCQIQYRLLRFTHTNIPLPPYLALSFSVFLWLGPLMGYWAMTVRPDLLGLLFDLCAATIILNKYPKIKWQSILFAAILCYLSWSSKQINVVMPLGIGLFLCWEKKWQEVFLFYAIFLGGIILTLIFASPAMLKMLFFIGTAVPISLETLLLNFLHFSKKTIPIGLLGLTLLIYPLQLNFRCWRSLLATVMYFVYTPVTRTLAITEKSSAVGILSLKKANFQRNIFKDPAVRLSLCGMLAWSVILLPASSKVGSAENYYFIALFFLILGISASLRYLNEEKSILFSSSLNLAGIIWLATLWVAYSSQSIERIKLQHAKAQQLKNCLQGLPQPIFVFDHYGALPWMNPSQVTFVLAYNYWNDRQAHQRFEQDGIGGLIQQGYFNSLIIPKGMLTVDKASLGDFHQSQECAGYAVYVQNAKENA